MSDWKPPIEEPLKGVKPTPNIYPCGCSRIKIGLGACDSYNPDGSERKASTCSKCGKELPHAAPHSMDGLPLYCSAKCLAQGLTDL